MVPACDVTVEQIIQQEEEEEQEQEEEQQQQQQQEEEQGMCIGSSTSSGVGGAGNSAVAYKYVRRRLYKLDDAFVRDVLENDLYVLQVSRSSSKDSGDSSHYVSFSTVDLLCMYCDCYKYNLQRSLIAFDEVCISGVQKPKIDFDARREHFEKVSQDYTTGGHVDVLRRLVKAFSISIALRYGIQDVAKSITPNVFIYSSCRREKVSFHLVCTSVCCTLTDCYRLCCETCTLLDKFGTGDYSRFVDKQVYSPKQCFRLLGSCKFNELKRQESPGQTKTRCTIYDKTRLAKVVSCSDYDQEPLLKSLVSWVDDITFAVKNVRFPLSGSRARRTANAASLSVISPPDASAAAAVVGDQGVGSSLRSVLLKAARSLYNSDFDVREPLPSIRLEDANHQVYLDRKSKGFCRQCKVDHDRENIKAVITSLPCMAVTRRSSRARSSSSSSSCVYE